MTKQNTMGVFSSVYHFYLDGFKGMVLGRKLWAIILIKLFIMFAVLKVFFFPDYLQEKFTTDEQRADFVLQHLSASAVSKKAATRQKKDDNMPMIDQLCREAKK